MTLINDSTWAINYTSSLSNKKRKEVQWPKISIVTPNLNYGIYLEETIRSVLMQNYPNLEYIVIDGGSSDASIEIIKKYENRIRYWISEPDRGHYDAINKGFKKATGDIFAWINSDDMYSPYAFWIVGSIYKELREKSKWISGLHGIWNDKNVLINLKNSLNYNRNFIKRGWFEGRCLGWIQQESCFWSKDLWFESGGHVRSDLNLVGDFELWLRFAENAELYTVNAWLGGFRRHKIQKTNTLNEYLREIDLLLEERNLNTMIDKCARTRFFKRWLRYLNNRAGKQIIYNFAMNRWIIK